MNAYFATGQGPRGQDPELELRKTNMEQLNRIELRGVVGNIRQLNAAETPMARISLATNYAYKDRDGVAVIDTSWHTIIAWQGRSVAEFSKIEKGTKLYVQGRIRYQRFTTPDGQERQNTEIVANVIQILEDKGPFQYEMQ